MKVSARQITGSTRLFAVLGDPVSQVQAPALLNARFAEHGIDAVLVPVHAPVARLAEIVRGLQATPNVDGLLVTVPHKVAIRRFADAEQPAVELTGSANALRREPDGAWTAANFDGVGFIDGLIAAGHDPRDWRAGLVGAGGAGRAIAVALLTAGVAQLTIHDTEADRLTALVDRLAACWPGRVHSAPPHRFGDVDVAVNATPLGLRPDDPLPFAPAGLPAGCVVADVVMKPAETALLRAAALAGRPAHHGIHMLTRQIDRYLRFFNLVPECSRPPETLGGDTWQRPSTTLR